MKSHDDTVAKRAVLLTTRIRFSPSGASIRKQAVERILEQVLSTADTDGVAENQIQNLCSLEDQQALLRSSDIRQGIASLIKDGQIIEFVKDKERLYALTEVAAKEIKRVQAESDKNTNIAIQELFGSAVGGEDAYRRAFLRLLCSVFSRLSDVYVRVITMNQSSEHLAEHQILSVAIDEVLKSEQLPDPEAFRYGVSRFFRESSPQFDQIKWNMAQNFYVAKALGLDGKSDLLTSDIFTGASLYCDTNVLISGLTPENRHYNSFQELSRACKSIGMTLTAAHPTVDELKAVISSQASLLKKVFDKIPDQTRPKVRNFLLEAYISETKTTPRLTIDEFTERFHTPLQTLQDSFGVVEEDSEWFIKASEDKNIRQLAKDIAKEYEKMRHRTKSERAAFHDAVLLQWVMNENAAGRKAWIVTLDITLSEWCAQHRSSDLKVVTLDAFLQWMTPVASGNADEDRLAEIFAEAIRYQLLPRDTFIHLRDFQVFAEMGIETGQLPADDVEACIRDIRQVGPHLDPSKAEDREQIGHVIQRYFVDPGTKYKKSLHDLQTQADELTKQLEKEAVLRKEAQDRVSDLEKQNIENEKKFEQESQARADAIDRIGRLEKTIEEDIKRKKLINSAIRRSLLSVAIFVLVDVAIVFFANKYGEGANLFQKITKASWWFGGAFAISGILWRILMGKERMALLKWWQTDDK